MFQTVRTINELLSVSQGAKKSDLIISLMSPEFSIITSVLDLTDGLIQTQRAFLQTGSPAGAATRKRTGTCEVSRNMGEIVSQLPSDRASTPRGRGRTHTGRGTGFRGEMDEDAITHSIY